MKNTDKVRNNLDYMHEKLQIQRFTDTLLSLSVCVVSSNISEEDRLNNMLLPKEKTSLFSIESALLSLGVNFVSVDISNAKFCNILRTSSLALINVHGEFGEDGRIQGLLDYFDIPYIGSSTLAHALSYDKLLFTSLLNGLNISTPKRYQISDLAKEFPSCSIIAKPRRGGSSIGIKIFDYFSQDILSYSDESYLFEEFIKGQCLTVGCLELEKTFLIGEIMEVAFMSDYYDNTSKMNDDGVSYVKTKSLSDLIHSNIIRDVKLILERVDYSGFVRFDIMLSGDDYYFLEANTIPGMSTKGNFLASISPKGFSYSDILVSLIKQTYEKHKESASVSTKN